MNHATTLHYEQMARERGVKVPQRDIPTKPARAKRGTGTHSVSKRRQLAILRWSREMIDLHGVFLAGVRCVNETNAREHPMARSRRAKMQRASAAQHLRLWLDYPPPRWPVKVTLVRYGPKKLDDDNLAASLKHIRDGVADWFGVDDGEATKYQWVPVQEIAPGYGVRIVIERIGGEKDKGATV
jgi:hypothetical protein